MSGVTIGELSIAGGAIVVAYKAIEFAVNTVRNKKNGNNKARTELACPANPVYLERFNKMSEKVDEIHDYTSTNEEAMVSVRQKVASGGFSCLWKDRDEIKDLLNALSKLTDVTISLTKEMRKANNGSSSGRPPGS